MSKSSQDPRIVHRAHLVNPKGGVSALCYRRPRAINLQQASWTITDSQVTCGECLRLMQGGKKL